MGRPGRSDRFDEQITEVQRAFASSVRELLGRLRVSFTEEVDGNRAEAWYTFRIETDSRSGPDVRVHIVDDTFVFSADEATLYRDRAAWGRDVSGWVTDSSELLQHLLVHPLRTRIRRRWFGRRTGAIWVPGVGGRGAWSGDWAACRGRGVEITFGATWYRRTSL